VPLIIQHKSYRLAMAAWGGEVEPFARFIEDGGELCPEARKFLAEHLRGEIKRQRGNPKVAADMERRMRAVNEIRATQFATKCSEYAAVTAYLQRHKAANRDTVRSWLRRSRTRVQK